MRKNNVHARQGQAITEFALVLPLLLLVVYGLLEVGRAVFIYAAVTNASREAVRYGIAYGLNASDVPKYQDCEGIRNAARSTGFYLNLQDSNIDINYDKGPGVAIPAGFDTTCDGSVDTNIQLECGDRITVSVHYAYSPMVSVVPQLESLPFDAESSRMYSGIIELSSDFTCQ